VEEVIAMDSVTLQMGCKDKKGIIAGITSFIHGNSGNIIVLDEFVDPGTRRFFMRVQWSTGGFRIKRKDLRREIGALMGKMGLDADWALFFSDSRPRMAIFVSKYDHCIYELLLKHRMGELKCDIPLIISNHPDLAHIGRAFGIPFEHVAVTKENRSKKEPEELALLKRHGIDFIVLARYMQVLSPDFISKYENKVINIHHSFLPAFEGADPYRRAFERGVKIIGATAHFVSADLDKGPIIQQGVAEASHKETVDDLMVKGREIERKVLADAVKLFIEHRIFVCGNRTIILS
jgi:formyltetrahydrofolate deformylase